MLHQLMNCHLQHLLGFIAYLSRRYVLASHGILFLLFWFYFCGETLIQTIGINNITCCYRRWKMILLKRDINLSHHYTQRSQNKHPSMLKKSLPRKQCIPFIRSSLTTEILKKSHSRGNQIHLKTSTQPFLPCSQWSRKI